MLDPLALDGRDYFASLLAEGQRCGLLSDRDLSRLQGESLTLLAERADAWSHGLSTSLPAERAQQLLGSVLYIVSLELKAGPTPEEAVERLRREPLAALYAAGQKRITRKLQAARTLHRQLKKTLFPTPQPVLPRHAGGRRRRLFQAVPPSPCRPGDPHHRRLPHLFRPAAAGRRGVYGGVSPLPVPREPFPSLIRPGDRPRPAAGTG